MLRRLLLLLDAIKVAHSVFALPFALMAMVVAAAGWPEWRVAGLVVACMVAMRSAAMAFNRWTDREFDAANPRTRTRPSVTGGLSPRALLAFVALSAGVLLLCAWMLNAVCFVLAFPGLAVLLGYSYAKRFTALSHFWLGFALGLAPAGAHLAVRADLWALPHASGRFDGVLEWFPLLLGLAVLLWTAGFDLIYACQDYEHDRANERLHSLPKSWGLARSLRLSAWLHAAAVAALALAGACGGLGTWYFGALAVAALLLVWEHRLVRPDDLSRVQTAFFTLNAAVGPLLLAATLAERVWLAGAP